jgi:hypothetical protein
MTDASHESRAFPSEAERFEVVRCAALALAAIRREYPFHLVHVARDDADVLPPRELHPAFGCAFDWHSAVHGHWCVLRALRLGGDAAFDAEAGAVLEEHLTRSRLQGELEYLKGTGREGFERPYGLAWMLQLAAELREWRDERARRWHGHLAALERLAATRLTEWLPRLPGPVRGGEHPQTAFAMGLALDHARLAGDPVSIAILEREARRFFQNDAAAPVGFEPSSHDFLSPVLGEADLMRRVLGRGEFQAWLDRFLPAGTEALERWLEPAGSPDPADGKLSHLGGLNLSRAWMLEGVMSALDRRHPLIERFARAAEHHRRAGLAVATSEHYAGSHWLGSFAVYLLTRRGLTHSTA